MRLASFCVGAVMTVAGLTSEFLPITPGQHVDEKFTMTSGIGLMAAGLKGKAKRKGDES